jgi:uncharacterized membrane protein YgdD (TMEM256/DUF423 family)
MNDEARRREYQQSQLWITLGALSAGVSVIVGAFGAHVLHSRLPADMMGVLETGTRYQMYHALGLIAVGLAWERGAPRPLTIAAWLFAIGSALFSGSLYALAITGVKTWGAVTPFGGLALILGWLVFTLAFNPRMRR